MISAIFFVVGFIMFMLPPVPGVPVYLSSGIILVSVRRARRCGHSIAQTGGVMFSKKTVCRLFDLKQDRHYQRPASPVSDLSSPLRRWRPAPSGGSGRGAVRRRREHCVRLRLLHGPQAARRSRADVRRNHGPLVALCSEAEAGPQFSWGEIPSRFLSYWQESLRACVMYLMADCCMACGQVLLRRAAGRVRFCAPRRGRQLRPRKLNTALTFLPPLSAAKLVTT